MAAGDYVNGYEHIGIPTNDMPATEAFYTTLGFRNIYETENDGRVVFFSLGSIVIEAYEKHGKAAEKRGAVDHIALEVTDVDAALEEIRKSSYPVIEGPNVLPYFEKGYRYFSILGPNSEVVEFGRKL